MARIFLAIASILGGLSVAQECFCNTRFEGTIE